MKMENTFAVPATESVEDPTTHVPASERDVEKQQQRLDQNAADFLRDSQELVRQFLEADRKSDNETEIGEIRRGMGLLIHLAEEQMATVDGEENKKKFETSINLLKNYKPE